MSSSLNTSASANGRRQSSTGAGYSASRRASSSVSSAQSPMSVVSSTAKSSAGGLRTPRSALRTGKQQMPKSEPRSASLHARRVSNSGSKPGAAPKNGLSLPVREPTSSLPNSPHSSDPDSLDEPGNRGNYCLFVFSHVVFEL